MTPDEWLADFEAKTAELQRNAVAFRRNLEAAGQTVTSEDKALTVTVAPNGALLDLKIAQNPDLAAKLMAVDLDLAENDASHRDDAGDLTDCRHSRLSTTLRTGCERTCLVYLVALAVQVVWWNFWPAMGGREERFQTSVARRGVAAIPA
jgi:hypothetical protein